MCSFLYNLVQSYIILLMQFDENIIVYRLFERNTREIRWIIDDSTDFRHFSHNLRTFVSRSISLITSIAVVSQ